MDAIWTTAGREQYGRGRELATWAGAVVPVLGMLLASSLTTQGSSDYGPAVWRPCYPSHLYTSGGFNCVPVSQSLGQC